MQNAGACCDGALGASDYNEGDLRHAQSSPSPTTSRNSPLTTDESPTNNSRADRPPRPMNAWLLFRTAQLRQMQEDDPGLRKSQGELSKIISEMWRGADPELKQHYEELAKQRKLEHQRAYPDYRYSPAKTQGKASKPKRSVSSGTSALRLSPSRLTRRPTYDASYQGHVQQQAVGGALGAYDGPAAGDSSSTASSSHGSPAYASLPTPSTAGWTHYDDWSLPASAMATYEGQENSAHPHFRRLREPVATSPSTVHPAALQPHLMPASAPATVTHFSSALGLTMSPHPSIMASLHISQRQAAHRSAAPPLQAPTNPTISSAYAPPAHYLSPPSSAGLSSSYSEPYEHPSALGHAATHTQPSTANLQDASSAVYVNQPATSSSWAPRSLERPSSPLVAPQSDMHGAHEYQVTSPEAGGPSNATLYRSPARTAYHPTATTLQYQSLPPPPHRSPPKSYYDTPDSHSHPAHPNSHTSTYSAQEYEHVSYKASSAFPSTHQLDYRRQQQYSQDPQQSFSYASHPRDPHDSHIYPQPPPSA